MRTLNSNTSELLTGKMYLALGATSNPDRLTDFSSSDCLVELQKDKRMIYFEVSSLKHASQLSRQFINHFGLGASNWIGGTICDENFNFIANVSYNGRIWDNEDWKISKEIQIC